MRRRTFLLTALSAGAAVSCGGGGSGPAPQDAFFGDSLLSGDIAVAAGEPARKIDVPPAQRVQEYAAGRFTTVAYAYPGARTADVLAGRMPFGDFAAHVAAIPAQTIVLRYGGSDAILGTDGAAFERDLTALVQMCDGKRVVLLGLIHSINYEARALEFNGRIAAVAKANGLQFIDTQALPFAGAADLIDGTHPTQAYSDRQARLIADSL